ncbi:Small-conductance mechanosensitive channel [Rhodobacteraceae bacterium SB2]|jgi:small conductance mechanosensitive channel|nr:mechanosensitive ion channel protein MscS [Marinovum sp.]MBT4230619.1 mechanosensitive ion channel [Paracoccaceae bacterium]MDA9854428.1 mechanosensitive ion channel [bacterium]OAH08349.1 Small-conductance mechanosensitive channel [Rhodobacteraceae bacterium SB2]WQC64344.1 mechanosensitive ion channel [Alphaproteobacteria bacterium US3C007]|tara:strand:- start:117 stop:944 length:828 start_codon:yes stop_codon:yes gene_type:complete
MTEIADLSGILMAEPVTAFLSNLAAAIAAIVITLFASRFVKSWIAKLGFRYEQLDDTLFVFLSKFAQVVVLAVGSVFVLNSFGVQTTSIVALLGAAGLAVGLALQGTLSNFAAGIMLIVFRPFKRGDYVSVSGQSGTVKEISIFTTELGTPDNLQIIVPNGQVWGAPITNFSAYGTRRLDVTFGVAYASDLKQVEEVLAQVIAADKRIHQDPAPVIKVSNLNQSSVDFVVRIWCDSSDLWTLRLDLNRQVKDNFDAQKIEIPFPTTTIVQQGSQE